MQTPNTIINKWKKVKEQGDLQTLMQITSLTGQSLSRILYGKQETTSKNILLIKDFLNKKSVTMNEAQSEEQD